MIRIILCNFVSKTGVAYLVDKTTMNLKTTFGASMVTNTMLE